MERFGYLTWYDNKNVKCDCGNIFAFPLSRLRAGARKSCREDDCKYSKPITDHPQYRRYRKFRAKNKQNKTYFWHWLEAQGE